MKPFHERKVETELHKIELANQLDFYAMHNVKSLDARIQFQADANYFAESARWDYAKKDSVYGNLKFGKGFSEEKIKASDEMDRFTALYYDFCITDRL
ncbi:hypothetical protein [Acetivibrio cellulolyticus]|uniref:hypothetical protein n=1 Tax=Acetivibrio cellulolyticus TaxID=35830 RepID=UPI0002481BFE|nr:hypothetical protein [Acetivibrio cellulolyticus]